MATPRIANAAPSRRLPDMSHSVHTVSPSTAMRGSRARRSGTPAKIWLQLRRTCWLPRKPRCGWAGHSLTKSSAKQATIASRSWALIAASSRSTTTAGPWSARSMTASPHSATLNCNRYRSMERTIGQRQAEASLRLQRPPSPSPPQPGDDPGRRPAAIPGGRLRRHHDRRDRRLTGREPVPAFQRADAMRERETDPTTIMRNWGLLTSEVSSVVSPILLLVRSAAASDPDMAELLSVGNHDRDERARHHARFLQQRGYLREGVTLAQATDILWTCTAPELYDLLVLQRGWSLPQYARFLADYMIAALLPQAQ